MVTQYPHTCTYATQGTADKWVEGTGWVKGEPGVITAVACRAKPSGSGKTIRNTDGETVEYSFDLAFPPDIQPIEPGTELSIEGVNGEPLFTGRLLRIQAGELHTRAWV